MRNIVRRELFDKHFERLPGFVVGKNGVRLAPAARGVQPRAARRKEASAFAAGEWRAK